MLTKNIDIILAVLCVFFVIAYADVADDIPLTGDFIGVGARATAVGGAYTAIAQDFSACYYNPAGLAYIYKNELSLDLMVRSGNSYTVLNSGETSLYPFSSVKLNRLGYVLPLKARRGGAAFAIGYLRSQSFDHCAEFYGKTVSGVDISAIETSDGGMGAIHIAAAVQTSKHAAVGASFNIITGAENYTWNMIKTNFADTSIVDSTISDKLTNGHSGISGKVGLMLIPSKYFSIGLAMSFPKSITTDQEYIVGTTVNYADGSSVEELPYSTDSDIRITLPFQFSGGIAFRSPAIMITADAKYTDWRQTRYSSSYMIEQNPYIPDCFRAVFAFGAGAEFTLPFESIPMKIRGGYRYDPLPYKNQIVNKERQAFTGGIAMLIGRNWLLESSIVLSNWKRTTEASSGTIEEEYKIYDIFFGIAYRY